MEERGYPSEAALIRAVKVRYFEAHRNLTPGFNPNDEENYRWLKQNFYELAHLPQFNLYHWRDREAYNESFTAALEAIRQAIQKLTENERRKQNRKMPVRVTSFPQPQTSRPKNRAEFRQWLNHYKESRPTT